MIQNPTRRELLIGGMATTIMGTLATSAIAKGALSSKSVLQGTGDPIVSVPPTVSASTGRSFLITITPPANYTPGLQYIVKLVRMNYGTNGAGEMTSSYLDDGLDGIVNGQFSTTITFPANSGPIVASVSVEAMSSQTAKTFTAVAYNNSNSASDTFLLTP